MAPNRRFRNAAGSEPPLPPGYRARIKRSGHQSRLPSVMPLGRDNGRARTTITPLGLLTYLGVSRPPGHCDECRAYLSAVSPSWARRRRARYREYEPGPERVAMWGTPNRTGRTPPCCHPGHGSNHHRTCPEYAALDLLRCCRRVRAPLHAACPPSPSILG